MNLKSIEMKLNILRDIVASVGPVSIVICVEDSFHNYGGGVYNPPTCGTSVDHAVVIVGYGTDPVGGDYWIVKNSWGPSFGEDGYIRMARNRGNLCIVAYWAVVSFQLNFTEEIILPV